MSYIWGGNSPTSGNTGDHPVDLRKLGALGRTGARRRAMRVVPDLYRRAIDHTAALAVAALLYLPIVWAYRDERRQAGAR